jgi:hypothetical protein
MYTSLHAKYLLLLSDFNETSIISTHFRKNNEISIFFKVRAMGVELFHANDRRTDRLFVWQYEANNNLTKFVVRA